ncbi:MAG: hypothetical protein PHV23_03335 [Candidatus Gracilibacteria bacterium]|nr:hypothetical protein [Candidatus Gracilibacteria bacterium]
MKELFLKFDNFDSLEFTLGNNDLSVNKILFQYFNLENNQINILNNFRNLISGKNLVFLDFLVNEFLDSNINFHFGIDKSNSRYKIFIPLYNMDFKYCLKKIVNIKNKLGIKKSYNLEKNFLKFDCIGFDFRDGEVDFKVYELIEDNNFDLLPVNISNNNIKEQGYLKTFGGRRKKFFRFNNYIDIDSFSISFNTEVIKEIEKEINNYYILKNKVKYYCIEGGNEEIYFF